MVQILMIVGDFPPSICGVGDYADMLSRWLVRGGDKVTIVTKRFPGAAEREEREGVTIRRISRGWGWLDIPRLLRVVDELGPHTIVHIQYSSKSAYNRRFMINILPAVLRLLRPNNPVVVTMHGFHEQSLKYRMRAFPMLLAANARVFVQSQDQTMVARLLSARIFPGELIPIASNIPIEEITTTERKQFRKSLGLDSDVAKLILFFGDLRPEKGFLALLHCLQKVREKGIELRLAVITNIHHFRKSSPTYAALVDQTIDDTDANQWMTILSNFDGPSVARAMRASDLAVFPFALGACENRGSLLAALANGLPVLSTRGRSTPKDFEDDYGIDSVSAGDERALSDRIELLLRDQEAMGSLKGKAIRVQLPTWDGIAGMTMKVYRELLATRRRAVISESRVADREGSAT